MSLVEEQIKTAREVYTASPHAIFAYLKGAGFERINYWYQHMAEVNMTDLEKVKAIAAEFLGVNLTPEQCGTVKGILGLQELVTSVKDAEIIVSFENAYNRDPVGQATTLATFRNAVWERCAKDIVRAWKWIASSEFEKDGVTPRTIEAKIEGIKAFGINPKEVMWTGSVAVWMATSEGIDFYAMVGLG